MSVARRMILPLLFGIVGCAILVSLGVWQVQRLAWKEGIISDIEARLGDEPVPLMEAPSEDMEYTPVTVSGTLTGEQIHVLTSVKFEGPGYRIIARLDRGTDAILVDLGFVLQEQKEAVGFVGAIELVGNLLWPDEYDSFTPEPNLEENIWFSRDLSAMAAHLDTSPILVVARLPVIDGVTPKPITANITNDHLQYAITWFSLALIWAAMTVFLLVRIRQKAV